MTGILTSLRKAVSPLGDRGETGPFGTAGRVVGGPIAIGLPIDRAEARRVARRNVAPSALRWVP